MRFSFTLLFLALLLTSCFEEVIFTADSPQEESVATEGSGEFLSGTNIFRTSHAYVVSQLVDPEQELYYHHLALTETDVLRGDDLRGLSDVVAFNFVTKGKDILGTHETLPTGQTFAGGVGLISYGTHGRLNFGRNQPFTSSGELHGAIRITQTNGEYTISSALDGPTRQQGLTGKYSGSLTALEPSEDEGYNGPDPQGPNEFQFYGFNHQINHAYLKQKEDAFGLTGAVTLYLSTKELVLDGELAGRSDLFMFNLTNPYTNFRGQFNTPLSVRYADRVSPFSLTDAYYCRNMDFSTRQADDDVPVTTLSATIQDHGESVLITFYSEDSYGEPKVMGRYRGPIRSID